MKILLINFFLTAALAVAEVPSLINYQGRLTNAEGEPLTGTKNFELKIFDSKTEGKLLYTENVGDIQLAEGGVYSFQFGDSGTSNTQTTETVGTGNGENLYQKVLTNTPVVEGSVSVSDGTYTWSQEDGSSNEDDFSSSFSKNLSRITVNYFADAPNDNRDIKVTYRYESEGIMGALSSGSEHWLQLSVDGETQAARERVLAVPFALRAGIADSVVKSNSPKKKLSGPFEILPRSINRVLRVKYFTFLEKNQVNQNVTQYDLTKFQVRRVPYGSYDLFKLKLKDDLNGVGEVVYESPEFNIDSENVSKIDEAWGAVEVNQIISGDLILDHEQYVYFLLSFHKSRGNFEFYGDRVADKIVNTIYYK